MIDMTPLLLTKWFYKISNGVARAKVASSWPSGQCIVGLLRLDPNELKNNISYTPPLIMLYAG